MRISPRISIGISVSVGVRSRACTRIGSRRPRPKYTLVDRHGKPGPGARRHIREARAVFQKPKRVWRHAACPKQKCCKFAAPNATSDFAK